MKIKIILISFIILITFLSSLCVIYYKNTVKVNLFCEVNNGECGYIKHDKVLEKVNFRYENIIQCSIETLYKSVQNKKNGKEKDAIDIYELNLHLINTDEVLNVKSKNPKELAMICAKISDKQPFKIQKRQKK